MQVGLVARKRAIEAEASGIAHTVDGELRDRFLGALPYELTGDQRAAIDAIAADMAKPVPMHRLLQGEVGSGKTLVAITALLMAVQGGYQGALMAPTEVLAEQLYSVASSMLAGARGAERGNAARGAAGDGRAAHQPRRRGRPPPDRGRASRRATSTSSSAPTRCSTATRRSRSSVSR